MLRTRAHFTWLLGRLPKFLGIAILNGVAAFAILICSAAFFPARFEDGGSPALIAVFVVWVLTVPAVHAMALIAKWLRMHYVITDRRVFYRLGVVRRDGQSIPLPQITNLSYRQGALDQMFGSGDLVIGSGGGESAIVLHRLPDIKKTHQALLDLMPRPTLQPPT